MKSVSKYKYFIVELLRTLVEKSVAHLCRQESYLKSSVFRINVEKHIIPTNTIIKFNMII